MGERPLQTSLVNGDQLSHMGVFFSDAASSHDASCCLNLTPEDQVEVTRGKMEQLRRIMEESKARRRARREARAAPYSTSWSVKSEATNAASANGVSNDRDGSESSSSASSSGSSGSTSPGGAGGNGATGNGKSANEAAAAGSDSNMFGTEPEPVTA